MTINKKSLTLDDYTESIHGGDRSKMQNIYEDDYDIGLSINIINARRAHGLTQTTLADALGTQQPNIARFESGVTLPSHDMIKKIARVLGVRPIPSGFLEVEQVKKVPTIVFSTEKTPLAYTIDVKSPSIAPQYAYAN